MYPSGCGVSFLGFKMGLKSAHRHWLESNYQSGLFPLTTLDLSRCWLHSLAEKALVRLLSIIIMVSLQRAMIPWSSFKEESWDGSLDGDEMIPGGTGRRLRGGRGGVRVRGPLSHQTRLTIKCSFGIVVFFGFGGWLDGLVGHLCGQYWFCKKDCDYHCRLETLMLISSLIGYQRFRGVCPRRFQ